MNIDLLPKKRWSEIKETVEKLFDAELPDEQRANVIAATDDAGNVQGFIICEILIRVGQIYGGTDSENLPKQMIDYALNNIPKGSSVVVIASEERFESMCQKFGMREIPGKIFRRDF
jgi:hypothetical protein